ncbi:MAG TPA: hypothetical protein VKY85_08405 [Candidatus Angelobacter sp.]|nr:hypothetical protein [Candidatus Angelobacter sp.]
MESPLAKTNEVKLVTLAKRNYSPDLYEAELRILHDSVRSGPAKPQPSDQPEARHVRSDFLRWLLNDTLATPLIDKDGFQVVAATIDGDVDLDNSHISCSLNCRKCIFKGSVHFVLAETRSIYITDSALHGDMSFQGATIRGDLFLEGFQSDGSITMYGARIHGDLSMVGAKLLAKDKALFINNAEISGAAYFQDLSCAGPLTILETKIGHEFFAKGATLASRVTMTGSSIEGDLTLRHVQSSEAVDLRHTTIAGSIWLDGAHLEGKQTSLSLSDATIAGDLYLMPDFHASGSVNLWRTVIKQSLWVNEAELAELDCTDAQIGGALLWAGILHPENTNLKLVRASVRELRDVKKSWPSKGKLSVGGFVYKQLSLEVPPEAAELAGKTQWKSKGGMSPDDRIGWLRLQSDQEVMASQPWMQLAQYIQTSGNADGARNVLDAMRAAQMRSKLVFYYQTFVEYPEYIVVPICLFWIFSSAIFWRARRMKAMAPTDKDAYEYFAANDKPPSYYVPFSPIVYALENVLPIANFGQDDAWAPNPQSHVAAHSGWRRWLPRMSYGWLATLRWVLVILGWVLAAILAGVIASFFKA